MKTLILLWCLTADLLYAQAFLDGALLKAATKGTNDDIEFLLDKGADPYSSNKNYTLIHAFAIKNNLSGLNKLSTNTDYMHRFIDQYASKKSTPLGLAIENNNFKIVKWLLANGAETNAVYGEAVHIALKYKRAEILNYIFEKRPKTHKYLISPIHYVPQFFDHSDYVNATPDLMKTYYAKDETTLDLYLKLLKKRVLSKDLIPFSNPKVSELALLPFKLLALPYSLTKLWRYHTAKKTTLIIAYLSGVKNVYLLDSRINHLAPKINYFDTAFMEKHFQAWYAKFCIRKEFKTNKNTPSKNELMQLIWKLGKESKGRLPVGNDFKKQLITMWQKKM